MHRFLLLIIVGVTASGSAFADEPSRLHGTYAFTGMSACIQDSASLGFNPNFTPKGPAIFFDFTVTGTRTFNDDGTGTVTGTSVAVGAPPNAFGSSASFTFQFTYTIAPGGMLSLTLVPGTFSGQEITGPRAGQTYVDAVPFQTKSATIRAASWSLSPRRPSKPSPSPTATVSRASATAREC